MVVCVCSQKGKLHAGRWLGIEGFFAQIQEKAHVASTGASVLMDAIYKRSKERLAEDGVPSPTVLKTETDRIARCYDALEARLSGQPVTFNLATIAAVSALGYANWRGADDNWREGRDGLSAWYDAMMQNRDVAESAPIF